MSAPCRERTIRSVTRRALSGPHPRRGGPSGRRRSSVRTGAESVRLQVQLRVHRGCAALQPGR